LEIERLNQRGHAYLHPDRKRLAHEEKMRGRKTGSSDWLTLRLEGIIKSNPKIPAKDVITKLEELAKRRILTIQKRSSSSKIHK
jgi:hypothetical protein